MAGILDKKVSLGVVVTSRSFFSIDLAADIRKKLLAKLKKMEIDTIIMPQTATPAGAVETFDDAKKYGKFFADNRDKVDGVLVCLPNFGDEQGVVEALSQAKLHVPVLVVAIDDEVDKLGTSQRRDSFCGKLSVCNNLYQYGIPFTNTAQHTVALESKVFEQDVYAFTCVCRVVKGLRAARFGALGARPEAFNTVRFSEKLLQRSGIKVVTADLSEIIGAANRLSDTAASVKNKVKAIQSYGKVAKGTAPEVVVRQAKLSVAIETWMDQKECVAGAIQCWDSIQPNYGCATCLTMSMLGEYKYMPFACEMDIAGLTAMYSLLLASGKQPGFLDWNNNFGNDRDKCIMYHCGNFPKSFFGEQVEIANLDVLGTILGSENCFGAVKGHVAPGPMTFARISTDDTCGMIKGYVGEGEFAKDKAPSIQGAHGVVKVPQLQKLLDHLCMNGYEHHVSMTKAHCAAVVEEAWSKYLGWEVYRHN